MLNYLHIKNYRNLEDLVIQSLGRINLITGKNNVGKSTLLEAVAIYAGQGDVEGIYQLLAERGEHYKSSNGSQQSTQMEIRSLSSLFSHRRTLFDGSNSISIKGDSSSRQIGLRLVRFLEEFERDNEGEVTNRLRRIVDDSVDMDSFNIDVGLEIRVGGKSRILSLSHDEERFVFGWLDRFGKKVNFQFLRPRNVEPDRNAKLWDSVTLTEKEPYVIDALRIIEPATERIAFVEDNPGDRRAVIKLATAPGVLPLLSMGDGINRILAIILALVNAEGGFLLIDEFENGLHHTVQERLWKIIFYLAQRLDIQVFATTHSEDCIRGFEQVLNQQGNPEEGKLIRLEKVGDRIMQVEYNARELKIAAEQDIETR